MLTILSSFDAPVFSHAEQIYNHFEQKGQAQHG